MLDTETEGVDLEAVEFGLRSRLQKVGSAILKGLAERKKGGYQGTSIKCDCGEMARFIDYRQKILRTVVGEISVRRAYYYCSGCGNGIIPQDREWDVVKTEFSPGLRRLMSRVGATEAFLRGSADLQELTGIRVQAKDVERVAEATGATIRRQEELLQEAIYSGKVIVPQTKESVDTVYIAVDGTGVPVLSKETVGRKGKGPDGKAKSREAKLGCIFIQTKTDTNGRPVRDEDSTTYIGIIQDSQCFGKELYAELQRRGLRKAKRLVVIGDGATWIRELADEQFPEAIQIVDLYHAREHLWKAARDFYPQQEKKRNRWVVRRIEELDRGDVDSILKAYRRLSPADPAALKTLRVETEFFRKNRLRMQYGLFRKSGLFVGSGVIEAGCKTVIGLRLKQSGMHWTVRGANSIISLRRCIMNGLWEEYWASRCHA